MFTALGFPAGSDSEIADAIVWLAAMRIVPLSHLAEHLPSLRYGPDTDDKIRSLPCVEFEVTVDQAIEHLLLIEIADALCACAIRHSCSTRATIRNMRNAALLLPIALRRSLENMRFEIKLSDFRAIVESGQIWTNFNLENADRLQLQSNGVVTCSSRGAIDGELDFKLSGLKLIFPAEGQSESGPIRIETKKDILWTLKQKATESFVPNSELSRRSGAGAEVDDSE